MWFTTETQRHRGCLFIIPVSDDVAGAVCEWVFIQINIFSVSLCLCGEYRLKNFKTYRRQQQSLIHAYNGYKENMWFTTEAQRLFIYNPCVWWCCGSCMWMGVYTDQNFLRVSVPLWWKFYFAYRNIREFLSKALSMLTMVIKKTCDLPQRHRGTEVVYL